MRMLALLLVVTTAVAVWPAPFSTQQAPPTLLNAMLTASPAAETARPSTATVGFAEALPFQTSVTLSTISSESTPDKRPLNVRVEALFNRLDQNGDGLLNTDEMPTALRSQLNAWDRNQDGLIDLQEFQQYVAALVQQTPNLGEAEPGLWLEEGPSPTPVQIDLEEEQGQQTVAAAETPSPTTLPQWARALDTDGDGQVSLAEWRAAGQLVTEFQRLDRNQDGFLTVHELPAAPPIRLQLTALVRGVTTTSANKATTSAPPAPVQKPPPPAPPSAPIARAASARLAPGGNAIRSDVPVVAPVRAALPAVAVLASAALPAPVAVSNADRQALTPSPISGTSNAYWTEREVQNELRLALGPAPILFLGDSITDWLATGAGKPIWDRLFAPLGAVDFAVGGITTSQVLWQVQDGQVADLAPEVVVLMIGTNNLALGQSPTAVAAGIATIVEDIKVQSPRSKVLLLGILPRGFAATEPLRAGIAQVNTALSSLDDGHRVHYLDIGSHFLQPDGSILAAVLSDGLHPTLMGYEILTAAIWEPLLQLAAGK
jgi:lysophospholipase L1-like esterase/Ca2+-binding EF-hand superfamily protein